MLYLGQLTACREKERGSRQISLLKSHGRKKLIKCKGEVVVDIALYEGLIATFSNRAVSEIGTPDLWAYSNYSLCGMDYYLQQLRDECDWNS